MGGRAEECRALQGRAGQGKAGRGRAGQGRAGQGKAGQGRVRQGRALQGRAGQGRAGQGRAGQGRAGQGRVRQGRAGQGRAGQGRAGQGRAGQGRAGQGRVRQGRARQGRAGQGRAGQGRAGQGRARQGRAGQGRATLQLSNCDWIVLHEKQTTAGGHHHRFAEICPRISVGTHQAARSAGLGVEGAGEDPKGKACGVRVVCSGIGVSRSRISQLAAGVKQNGKNGKMGGEMGGNGGKWVIVGNSQQYIVGSVEKMCEIGGKREENRRKVGQCGTNLPFFPLFHILATFPSSSFDEFCHPK